MAASEPESKPQGTCEHEWELWLVVDSNGTGESYAECRLCHKRDTVVQMPIKYEPYMRGKHKITLFTPYVGDLP